MKVAVVYNADARGIINIFGIQNRVSQGDDRLCSRRT